MEDKTLRVKQELVNRLLNIVGDVVTNYMEVELVEKTVREIAVRDAGTGQDIARLLKDLVIAGKKTSDELVSSLMEIRMVPLSTLFSRFNTMVRTLSRDQGKKVDFATEGEDTLVDKNISEKMADPLVHMLRNSVDHGIEPFEERKNSGKPEMGTITLKAHTDEDNVYFIISDDGKGLDYERFRSKAVDMGLATRPEVESMSDDQVGQFMFHPGFSTAAEVTDISGRGVGMDVVKRNMDELKAKITVESIPGQGTTITFRIPRVRLVDIIDAVIIEADEKYFGVPIKSISRIINISADQVHQYQDRPFVNIKGQTYTLYSMYEILEDDYSIKWRRDAKEVLNVLLIGDETDSIGILLDNVLDVQRVVIKKAGGYFDRIQEILGVAGIGRGEMANIINPEYLMKKHLMKKEGLTPEEAGLAEQAEQELQAVIEEEEEKKHLEDVLDPDDMNMFSDILADVQDHLSNIDQDIQLLESEPGMKLFERLFRGFHSVKGAFGTLKLDQLVVLTNSGEDLLSLLREDRIEIDSTLVDLLYGVADVIESAVSELQAGFYPELNVEKLNEELTLYKESVVPADGDYAFGSEMTNVVSDTPFDLNVLEILTLQKTLSTEPDSHLYEIYVRVDPEVVMKPVRSVVAITKLFHQGTVISSVPSIRFIETSEDYESFKLLYYSSISIEDLKEQMGEEEIVGTMEISLADKEKYM